MLKDFLRKIFVKTVKFLSRGLNLSRFRPVSWLYGVLYARLKKDGGSVDISIVNVGNFKLDLDDKDSLGLSIFRIYEEFETGLLIHEIKPGNIVIDVGANIGYYTVIFSKLVSENGKVFAFEPDPTNFEILRKNTIQNNCKNIFLEKEALSDKNENVKLYISEENRGDHRIYDSGENRKSIEVKTVRLDDYLGRMTNKIDLLKMDIQGAEVMALEGMRRTLRESKNIKIFSEFWPPAIKKSGRNPKIFFDILSKNNFSFSNINAVSKTVEQISDIDSFIKFYLRENAGVANIIAIKK